MRIIFLSLCLGLLSLNAFSQSKLQGAGKASKVGISTAVQKMQTDKKPSAIKKPRNSSSQTKHNFGEDNKYASNGYMEILDGYYTSSPKTLYSITIRYKGN